MAECSRVWIGGHFGLIKLICPGTFSLEEGLVPSFLFFIVGVTSISIIRN